MRFEIESNRVADFARAIGADPNDGVPPTFAAAYALEATAPELFGDEEAAIDLDHGTLLRGISLIALCTLRKYDLSF